MKKLITVLLALLIFYLTFNIENCRCQWVQMSDVMGTNQIAYRLVSNGTYIFAMTIGTGVYRSSNNGVNWTAVNNGIPIQQIAYFRVIIVNGNNIFLGLSGGYGIYRSSDNGNNWIAVNNGFTNQGFNCLVSDGTNIFAGNSWSGVYLSTNNGANWNSVSNGLPSATINSIIINGTNIFAGTYMNGVYRSTNNGGIWTYAGTGLPNQIINCLASSGTNIFAGTDTAGTGGVYISTNNGGSWSQTSLNNTNVYGLTSYGSNLFAGTWSATISGAFLSTNNGINWINKNQGFNLNMGVASILFANNYLFAGTNQSVWRRSYTEAIGIKQISEQVPSKYSLEQNYPNPFNPSTNIRYELPKNSFVKIVVFDMLGREIETLVNEKQSAGTYEVTWDATKYPSSVYFYRLTTDGFSETKKMLMIK